MTRVRVLFMTAPDEETAAKIARVLVEERLAACVNIVPRVRSIYRWEGAIEDAAEVLCVVKTVAEKVAPLLARIQEVHPYKVAEGLALAVESGLPDYLAWVIEETSPQVL
jgi:periplasmic divalent cation tolerance protein